MDNLTTLCSERKAELQQLQDSTRGLSLAHAKRERDIDGDDESDVANQSRVSKRSRIGSTANDMHDEEDDADEAIIQDLLHEKQQRIHELQRNVKLTKELCVVRKKLRKSAKERLDQQNAAS